MALAFSPGLAVEMSGIGDSSNVPALSEAASKLRDSVETAEYASTSLSIWSTGSARYGVSPDRLARGHRILRSASP
jgi:hypothetical protein